VVAAHETHIRGLVRRTAPDVITGINRLRFGCELVADARPKSITSDKQICSFVTAVGEINVNAVAVLLYALEHVSVMIMLSVDRL